MNLVLFISYLQIAQQTIKKNYKNFSLKIVNTSVIVECMKKYGLNMDMNNDKKLINNNK